MVVPKLLHNTAFFLSNYIGITTLPMSLQSKDSKSLAVQRIHSNKDALCPSIQIVGPICYAFTAHSHPN